MTIITREGALFMMQCGLGGWGDGAINYMHFSGGDLGAGHTAGVAGVALKAGQGSSYWPIEYLLKFLSTCFSCPCQMLKINFKKIST